ncbi:hypothetical protein [Hirschia baltica]|uniref:Lipoprotein n=1 Tax=Hirschia baltica (strain ATCC 49814 / DSM 5838 / IFAM 1418) TaxID=582402 RepID=C6XJ79_HIRBI|nr:hypothetical protein [Hirschia baltica]ACT59174.1 conserved hypothetical protein [Hirschia baltica ATCC 49814]
MHRLIVLIAAFGVAACTTSTPIQQTFDTTITELEDITTYTPPPVQQFVATTLREYVAPEADQGVAVDADFFYPIDNTVIGKYRRDTGQIVARFTAPHKGLIRHMNSCYARYQKIWCANSNYSQTPMGSSIEIFDATTLKHIQTHSLGMRDEGSLTWFDEIEDGYIAGFAHYSKNGGLAHKGYEYSSVVTFDKKWRRTGGWMFPKNASDLMAPYAASGGALGPDGLLYILGHDKPEMYVLAMPTMGPTMIHVATIQLKSEAQAFSFSPDKNTRKIWAIERHKGMVREIEIPQIGALPEHARKF